MYPIAQLKVNYVYYSLNPFLTIWYKLISQDIEYVLLNILITITQSINFQVYISISIKISLKILRNIFIITKNKKFKIHSNLRVWYQFNFTKLKNEHEESLINIKYFFSYLLISFLLVG